MSAHLTLPLAEPIKQLLDRADRWWYCGRCRYVSRTYPYSDDDRETAEHDDVFPPCPACSERLWHAVSGCGREERWAFVVSELPQAAARALRSAA